MTTSSSNVNDLRYFDRLSDIPSEPQSWLLLIKGHESMPLVSLEEAVEPLQHIVADLKRIARVAKQNCEQPADGLTPDESASIMLYTMEWEPHDQCLCIVLNKCLRDKQREKLKPWFLYLKLFLTALDKLPSLSCTVFRGVKFNLTDRYSPGSKFIWWGFSSCTANIKTLQSEKFYGKTNGRTLFIIECYSGKNIRQHSYYQYENELLLPLARHFTVIDILDQGNDSYIVQLKETEPSYVPLEPIPSEQNLSLSTSNVHLPILKQNPKLEKKIQQYQHSTRMNLTFEALTDEDMSIVARQILMCTTCTELDLANNKIGSNGVSTLAAALRKNTTLKALSLLSNQVADQGIRSLADSLSKHNSTLTILGLGSNDITDEGIKYLAEMLRTNQTLTSLTLQNNKIGNQGVELLMEVLIRYNKTMTVLNISSNTLINDLCVNAIINMLDRNQTLKEFYLINCNLSPTTINQIKQMAKSKRRLELHL